MHLTHHHKNSPLFVNVLLFKSTISRDIFVNHKLSSLYFLKLMNSNPSKYQSIQQFLLKAESLAAPLGNHLSTEFSQLSC